MIANDCFDCNQLFPPWFLVPISKGHIDTLAPTVQELVELEKRVQTSFFALRNCRNIMATS